MDIIKSRQPETYQRDPNWIQYDKELTQDWKNEERVRDCFEDGTTWVGVFECNALDSSELGRRTAFPFDTSQFDQATLGTRAPDTKSFIGWKYGLIAKCRTAEEALMWLRREEPK